MPTETAERVVRRPGQRAAAKRAHEFESERIAPQKLDSIKMPEIFDPIQRGGETILPVTDFKKEQADALAFAEEPIKIMIHRAGGKNPPPTTDLISVNGIHAELLFKNGWVPIGYIPRGQVVVTKRKYVEQIARAKTKSISTRVVERENENPLNLLDPVYVASMAFSVVHDPNPRGQQWLEKLLYEGL